MIKTRSFLFEGREYQLQAEVISCGEDLCIVFSGGDQPHIGASALGVWTSSPNNPEKRTATPSVIAVPGHKESQLALAAAEMLSKSLERTVAVTVGIHIEGITPELIDRVVEEFHVFVADLSVSLIEK
jgi:gallate decarboxylase subunit D